MKTVKTMFLAALLAGAANAAPTIQGDYLESRTADVYTGPCFANGEVNLAGHEAILAWRIREGSWLGVGLEGLSVVAVVKASATLGDPHADPYPARSVLLVDHKASVEQRKALIEFARSMGGRLLQDVVRIESTPITVELGAHGEAKLRAGELAEITTRCLNDGDRHCRNEEVYYPPLTEVQNPTAAYTVAQAYRGEGLDARWSCPDKRSAFIARFSH